MNLQLSQPCNGACLCSAVHYRIRGEVLGFQYCHCTRCQRFTGSAHAANLFVRPDDLEWTRGADEVTTFLLDAEPGFPTAFCRTCGSPLPALSSTGRFWVVPTGGLADDPGIQPTQSIFWESRAPWYREVNELPKHAELPEPNG